MKWVLFSVVACFCIQYFAVDAAIASEATCQAEHEAVKSCVHAIFADAEEARAKRKAAFAACFTDNNCTNPEDQWKAKKEAMAKKFECKKDVFKNTLKPKLEGCVQNIFPDFTFPNISGEHHMHHGHHRGHHRGHQGQRGHHGHHDKEGKRHHKDKCAMKEKFFEEVCPVEASRQAAKACLEALRAERGHEGHHHMMEKKRQVKACFKNNTTPECRERHEVLKATMCSCAAENLGDATVTQAIESCHNSNTTADVHEEDEKAEDHEHHRKAMRHMVKMFCHKGHHGHHKGGRHQEGARRHEGARHHQERPNEESGNVEQQPVGNGLN